MFEHSPRSGAEVKNEWNYTSTPSIRLHGFDRNNFTLPFTFKKLMFPSCLLGGGAFETQNFEVSNTQETAHSIKVTDS